ncbi:MAG: acyltransferase [Rikenellaceae bacterium]
MKQSSSMSKRVESMDAFRGVASFLIMVTHFILCVPEICQVQNLGYIYGGLSWKLPYFFVLSGFVLSISYARNRERLKHPFRSFVVSRLFRIYPLFFITTVLMFLMKLGFGAGSDIEGASTFFNISWRLAPRCGELVSALTLIGLENTWLYNGPAWTLVFEMRYALVFPLIWGALRRWWYSILLLVGAVFYVATIAQGLERTDIFYSVDYVTSNLCSMVAFMLFYVGGVLLSMHRTRLAQLYGSLTTLGRWGVVLTVLVLVLNPLWGGSVFSSLPSAVSSVVGDLLMLIGVATWIVVLINDKFVSRLFSNPTLIALGRSSFSIYMWHMPIITLLYLTLRESLDVWYIVALSVVVTLVVAQLSFRYIEQPIIEFGRRFRI